MAPHFMGLLHSGLPGKAVHKFDLDTLEKNDGKVDSAHGRQGNYQQTCNGGSN